MNVYEAIAASPIGVAWHTEHRLVLRDGQHSNWDVLYPDGWQPLYTSHAEYTLGEPLTEAKEGQVYIAKKRDKWTQGEFTYSGRPLNNSWTYYADPRPWPKLPEVKEEPKLNAYELPIGTEIVIGKRRFEISDRDKLAPDRIYFRETTGGEPDPIGRVMYPSEVQWLIDNGAKVTFRRNAKPGPKEEPNLLVSYGDDCNVLTDEGRRRLEKLLQESECE